jgi:hypothetical protein
MKEALMLPREAGRRQILGGRRAAHGHRDAVAAALLERAIGGGDVSAQSGIAGRLVDELPRLGGAVGELRHIVMVEIGKQPTQFGDGTAPRERVAIGFCGQSEPVRHAGTEQRMELAKGGGLATNRRYILEPDIVEPTDEGWCRHHAPPSAIAVPKLGKFGGE